MANELLFNYFTGCTLYAQCFDATGNIWNGSAHVEPNSANWLDYDIAMSEVATATGIYRASMPAAAAGVYGWTVRKQAGASPAVGDVTVGAGEIRWTGTAEETVPAAVNVTTLAGATEPLDNLVLALGTGGLVEKLNSMLEAAGQDYRFTAEALEEIPISNDSLVNIKADTAAIRVITDNIDVSAVTHVAESNAGYLTITIGRTFNQLVSGLVIPVDLERTYVTIKRSVEDDESESVLQILSSNPEDTDIDGVQRLNGVLWHETVVDNPETEVDETNPEPFSRDLGALIVNQESGNIRIFLTHELTAQFSSAQRIGWDVKFIDSSGNATGKRGVIDLVRTETQTV